MCVPVAGCVQNSDLSSKTKFLLTVASFIVDYSLPITLLVVGTLGIIGPIVVSPAASWALIGAGAGWIAIESTFVISIFINFSYGRRKAMNNETQLDLQKPKIEEVETSGTSTGGTKPPALAENLFEDGAT